MSKWSETYDKPIEESAKLQHLLHTNKDNSRCPLVPVTEEQMGYIRQFKTGKAPDIYGVPEEHIKLAGDTITPVLAWLTNDVLHRREIPDAMKMGASYTSRKKGKRQHKT